MASPTLALPLRPEFCSEESGLCDTVVLGKGVVVYVVIDEKDVTPGLVVEGFDSLSKTMPSLETLGAAMVASIGYSHN